MSAAAHLKLVFAERNETGFTEIAQGAVRALGTIDEPTDLLLALDTRIQHILGPRLPYPRRCPLDRRLQDEPARRSRSRRVSRSRARALFATTSSVRQYF